MSYSAFESSKVKGQPVELYYARYGSDPAAFIAFCDADREIIVGGVTYLPRAVQRGNASTSGTLDKTKLIVSVSMDSELAELFRVYPPSSVVTLTIKQGHYDDPDNEFVTVWVGRILGSSRAPKANRNVELTCEPASTSMRRLGLQARYTLSCRTALYGAECQADKVAATVTSVLTAVSYLSITATAGWETAFDPQKFIGGMIQWTGTAGTEYRTILSVAGDTLNVNGPTTGLSVGDTVSIVLGCNHLMEDCNLHNNISNFRGFPWIPNKSVINTNPYR
jgi:uncharacterized phage protein (TIGR02218 family)